MPTFLLYTANVYLIIYMHMCLNLVVARSTVHVHAFIIQSLICAAQQFGEGVTSISQVWATTRAKTNNIYVYKYQQGIL